MKPPRPLTPRQHKFYTWVFRFTCQRGYQPSYAQIMARFGFKTASAVGLLLRRIARGGWVAVRSKDARALRFRVCPDGRPFAGFAAIPKPAPWGPLPLTVAAAS